MRRLRRFRNLMLAWMLGTESRMMEYGDGERLGQQRNGISRHR